MSRSSGRAAGFEPATRGLAGPSSAVELRPHEPVRVYRRAAEGVRPGDRGRRLSRAERCPYGSSRRRPPRSPRKRSRRSAARPPAFRRLLLKHLGTSECSSRVRGLRSRALAGMTHPPLLLRSDGPIVNVLERLAACLVRLRVRPLAARAVHANAGFYAAFLGFDGRTITGQPVTITAPEHRTFADQDGERPVSKILVASCGLLGVMPPQREDGV